MRLLFASQSSFGGIKTRLLCQYSRDKGLRHARRLVSPAENLFKTFGPRSGPAEGRGVMDTDSVAERIFKS